MSSIVSFVSCVRLRLHLILLFCSHPSISYVRGKPRNGWLAKMGSFVDVEISIEGNGLCISVSYKTIDSHSYLLYSSSHPSHVKNSIPFSQFLRLCRLCSDDSDFSEKSEAMCQISINVAILFLSFKRAIIVPNKLIDSQHHKQLRRKNLIAFHSLSHFTLTTTQLNLSFLKTLNYSKSMQRLVLSFRNLY